MGKIISVSNQKGGVGKTTTALNLSACLGILEQKVLLIDLDPQANATSGIGIDLKKNKYSSYQLLEHTEKAENIILKSNTPKIINPVYCLFGLITVLVSLSKNCNSSIST